MLESKKPPGVEMGMPTKMRCNIVRSLEGLLKLLPQPVLGRAMNVAGGLFLLSSQCSFAAFGAAGEVGHSGVWECRAGVPHLWNVPSSGSIARRDSKSQHRNIDSLCPSILLSPL